MEKNTQHKYITKYLKEKPIIFHPVFKRKVGSVTAAILLQQVAWWSDTKDDGWFYKTQKDWEFETALTRYELDTAREKLLKLDLIEYETRGVGNKGYYKLNEEQFEKTFFEEQTPENTPKTPKNTTKIARKPVDTQSLIAAQEADLIKEFERAKINPAVDDLYKMKAERTAARNIINKLGFEGAKRFINEVIPLVNANPYSKLTIVKPTQLWRNFGEIGVALQKMQTKKDDTPETIIV